ncbi:gliding motility-associated C-terminal domain-containing protein [Reichenbachiella ulvae]|uniref:Gliding motility-associated C-terminal domain-containing protein n=1 Tax=Reichenbachiella ulvae TaxID=2980104 RepID=A0ABT3CTG1_9BACT|nr:gliding motility-associated C-terminal domain-containing protein [Reichenbachiella ulvae]MCV9386958.1 gliding motility-associated C-terminal domain-containing protein [Reichenbachiella ulvae]
MLDEQFLSESIVADEQGRHSLTELKNGIYSQFQFERLECASNLIEEPVSFICGVDLYNTPVITPNGDGYNDFMEIEGIEDFPTNHVSIFNRWGNLVWETDSYRNNEMGFGGRGNTAFAGGDLNDGTYFIVIDLGNSAQRQNKFVVIKR